MLTLPLKPWLLSSSQNYPPFLSRMTKGKSLRGHLLLITRRASILILIIIIITNNSILILRRLWRRRWRSNEATKASLSSCNTTNMGVHLIQLSSKSIKVSIYALKLRHDCLKSHTNSQRRKSGSGRNGRGWRIRRLGPRLLLLKLGLASSNRSCADGTHDSIKRRIRNKDRKMVKAPCDSWRKNEFITGWSYPYRHLW